MELGKAMCDHISFSHCQRGGLVKRPIVSAEAERKASDQSSQGHQCSETALTGEIRCPIVSSCIPGM
jgi:hypothetical protein